MYIYFLSCCRWSECKVRKHLCDLISWFTRTLFTRDANDDIKCSNVFKKDRGQSDFVEYKALAIELIH